MAMGARHRLRKEETALIRQEREVRTDIIRADLPWYMQRNLRTVLTRWLRSRKTP
jgi:hypothetical protein